MIVSLLDGLKVSAGALVGALIGYQIGQWQGYSAGYDKRVAEAAIATAKAEVERRGDDAKLQSMSDYDLCVTGLRAGRVPVEPCDVLRGMGEE